MPETEGERRGLMAGQLDVWSAQQLSPGDPINVGAYVEIHGDLDMHLFETALRLTMGEVDAVHLRFCETDGTLSQFLAKSDDWPLNVIDVSTAGNPRAAAEDWMWADMRRPVDLREGPLFNHVVFKAGRDWFFWYQRGHHIAIDGLATRIIAGRLAQVYNSLLAGQSPTDGTLEPVSVLIDADAAYKASRDFSRDRKFWSSRLATFPVPADMHERRALTVTSIPLRHAESIDPGIATDLRMAARRLSVTLDDLMIAASAMYLRRSMKAEDVVVGIAVPGRSQKRLCGIPGVTINVLPVRLTIDDKAAIGELVLQASRSARDAVQHQRYRYSDIRADLELPDGMRLFGLTIDGLSAAETAQFDDCVAITHELSKGIVDGLSIGMHEQGEDGGIELVLNANPDLYNAEAVTSIAHHFKNILRYLTKSISCRL